MIKKSVSVLLICDAKQHDEIKTTLDDARIDICFNLHWSGSLSEGLEILNNTAIDVVLLVLALLDSYGTSGLTQIRDSNPDVPVVVMVETSDAAVITKAVQNGGQDVLVKQEVTGNALARSLLFAIERQRIVQKLQTASLVDELTGLYNRRGFMNFASHYVQVSRRSRKGMLLFYADLDNMKFINDNFGHQAGDQAIVATTLILKSIFRGSDIIARIGGDEFVVLVVDTTLAFAPKILGRLREKEKDSIQPYPLSLSVGFAYYDPENPCTIQELLVKADKYMYENKRTKRNEMQESTILDVN
ncbi:diguanylate cyclase [Sporomusa sp. KB1]|jgi:diguanylate cyclase (GGDEF)-like protein|uniref:diguanylate cyclase n=1 Tax=Sporomusa sp. KB1 TaxID=943346 RepID=UPI00119FD0C7|nr:diguanylate cyclase [Sporomusa sp. KB1]TWH47454.1 diguanylate cyclase (GGDEF)-like protein [Sporomusa sp. KB1]